MSTLVKIHALGDNPTFAPVRKLPTELLAEIFILCISTLPRPVEKPDEPPEFEYGMDLQAARAQLARVCRWWNTVLNNYARVWATVALDIDRPIAPEIVTLWIKRSKSHPLDICIKLGGNLNVYYCDLKDTRPMVAIFHTHLWRIRSLVWRTCCRRHSPLSLSTLFPPSVSTCASMIQNLCLIGYRSKRMTSLGDIHCPDLRTLTIEKCDEAIQSLVSKPMPNIRHLRLVSDSPVMLYIELLTVLPNLVSLTWIHDSFRPEEIAKVPNSRVVLQSLRSLTLVDITPHFLAYFYAPSLESLKLAGNATNRIHVLKMIYQDWNFTLHHLTITGLTGKRQETINFYGMFKLSYLTHLETLVVHPNEDSSVDGLLIALSPYNRDFTWAFPQLKTMEIYHGRVDTCVLVHFVQWRVKPDLDDPVPGLMTSLKLSSTILVGDDVCEQLGKTYGSSVHIQLNSHHRINCHCSVRNRIQFDFRLQ